MLKPPRMQSVWFLSICLCFKIRWKVWLGSFLARKVLFERVQAPPGTLHKNVQYFYKAWAQAEFKVLIRCKSDVGISSKSSAFARALSQSQSKLSYLLPWPNSPVLSAVVPCKSIQAEPEMSFFPRTKLFQCLSKTLSSRPSVDMNMTK